MYGFDPKDERDRLLGRHGYDWNLGADFDHARSVGGLASNASAFMTQAVYCLLVGFDNPATDLLKKSEHWLKVAIAEDERPKRYFPHGTESSRFRDLASCIWLLYGKHDAESLRMCLKEKDFYYQADQKAARDKVAVSFALPAYISAGAYERVLKIFAGVPRLTPPKDLSTIRGEAAMCFVLARHRLGLEYSHQDVTTAIRKFLNRNVNSWLTNGHAERATEWMKIAYWDTTRLERTPKEAVLMCYDHLPGVAPPPELE